MGASGVGTQDKPLSVLDVIGLGAYRFHSFGCSVHGQSLSGLEASGGGREEDGLSVRYAMEFEFERQMHGLGCMPAVDTSMVSFLTIQCETCKNKTRPY